MLKIIYNNRFYFWMLFISMTFISYLSIYESLVINRTYSLVIIYFLRHMSLFLLFQLLSMLLIIAFISGFNFKEINKRAIDVISKRVNIILIYALGSVAFLITSII
jgi:hypothetical protein